MFSSHLILTVFTGRGKGCQGPLAYPPPYTGYYPYVNKVMLHSGQDFSNVNEKDQSIMFISDIPCRFQSQSGFCLVAEVNVMYIPWDPPRVLHVANLLIISIVGWQFKMAQHCHLLLHSPSLGLELNPRHMYNRSSTTVVGHNNPYIPSILNWSNSKCLKRYSLNVRFRHFEL